MDSKTNDPEAIAKGLSEIEAKFILAMQPRETHWIGGVTTTIAELSRKGLIAVTDQSVWYDYWLTDLGIQVREAVRKLTEKDHA